MSMRRRAWFTTAVVMAVILVAILPIASGATRAQQESGSPTAPLAHPVHIHSGSCDNLGDIAYPLTDLVPPAEGDTQVTDTAKAFMGEIDSTSKTTIELPQKPHDDFEHFIAGGHSITVHASAEDIGTYIACGDIVGRGNGNQFRLELHELNDSGYQGLATLTNNHDGTMTLSIVLSRAEAASTPVASPTA